MKISHFKLERYFAKYELKVDYLLCSSDCESLTIHDLLSLESEADIRFRKQTLGYTESQGNLSLRREICGLYHNIETDQVLVHSGGEEAIFLFMYSLLESGDHIIVHWPCYQSLYEVAQSIGCEITRWQAREENDWALDLDELKHQIRFNTKAVIFNLPHNPTGYLMPIEDFQELNRIVRENKIILFSDEVYRESEYSVDDRLPAACDLGDHAVSLGVMSKTYGLAGLRIGWIATQNEDIYNKIAMLKDYTTICNSAPSEFLAELALRHRESIIDRNVGIIKKNLNLLDQFFQKHKERFVWKPPKAGPIAFPRLIGGDIEKFCENLVNLTSVLLLPGNVYDNHDNHFRIGFGRINLPDALTRLDEFLNQHRL